MRTTTRFAVSVLAMLATCSAVHAAAPAQPATVEVEKNLSYLEAGRNEKLDLYRPKAAPAKGEKRPAVVIIHGGGWTGGDKAAERELGIGYTVAEAGWVGISINYQLATKEKSTWPGCFDDCRAAVRFLRDNADKYGIDPDRIAAIGGSAGGHLALLMGSKSAGAERVKAVIALYPPTDLTQRGPQLALFGKDGTPEQYLAASPIHQLSPDFPPVLLMHGTADKTVPLLASQSLEQAMKQDKLDVKLVVIEGAPHTFPLQFGKHDLRTQVMDFFKASFAKSAK